MAVARSVMCRNSQMKYEDEACLLYFGIYECELGILGLTIEKGFR